MYEPDPKVTLIRDLDFTFTNGIFMPISLDETAGDSVEYPTPETIVIHMAAKPSPVDPTLALPAEDITIYVKNILTIQHRKREVTELTVEQKIEWRKAMTEQIKGSSIN